MKNGHKHNTRVYLNDGTEISGGSVAAPHGNQLVIGSASDHKLLMCTQGAPPAGAAPKPVISGPERDT